MTSRPFESCDKCPIFFLALRNPESEDEPWTNLFRLGQELCRNEVGEKAKKSFNEALNLAEALAAVKDTRVNHIKATMWTCIGTLSLCGQIQPGAIENLRRGEVQFGLDGDAYSQAVALFALGVFNETQEEWGEVRHFYERSLKTLGNGGDDKANLLRVEIKRRYRIAHDKWIAAEIGNVPSRPATTTSVSSSGALTATSELPNLRTPLASNSHDAFLAFMPIFSEIPAGDPRTIPDRVTGYIETEHILIDAKPYKIVSPDGIRVKLKFQRDVTYVALRVSGDSMDRAGIDDGDYVILETRSLSSSRQPQNNEIVAAALEEEHQVTLKRFFREEKRIILKPDSNNLGHKSYPFDTRTEWSLPVRIVGFHVATLKLVSRSDESGIALIPT